ncbi:MAG: agmatinase [Acidisphaera sp.]|nr:agmatinase [Acidisphaera sp.]MBV9812693.1 agmatinase [Acetobacteraceae bacterium]
MRARYLPDTGWVQEAIDDPDFRRAREFSTAAPRKLPYADVATLLDAPYRPNGSLDGLDVALIGVPLDLGVTNRSGTRLGPRAVRAVERIGPYHHALRVTPLAELAVADIGDVPFGTRYSLEESIADIERFYAAVSAAGVIPLGVGGDHSMSYPILRALGRDRPLGLVHIDAHCDTAGVREGSRLHHGGPFRQAVLDGVLDPERTVQIGIRGSAEMLYEFSYWSGMTVIHAEEIDLIGLPAVIARARAVVGDQPFYISFDVDSLDPAFAPGTGTPEVGGLTPREVQHLLRGLRGLPGIVGGDVVEVAPQYDATTTTAQIGATMLWELLALIAAGKRAAASGRPAPV